MISKSLFRATFENLNEGPDCEPGLVFDAIHVEDSSLVPGALLVRPAQHKSEQNYSCNKKTISIQRNLGGRSSPVCESRVANERELEESAPTSWVLSKEKTFRLSELGTLWFTKSRIKNLDIWLARDF